MNGENLFYVGTAQTTEKNAKLKFTLCLSYRFMTFCAKNIHNSKETESAISFDCDDFCIMETKSSTVWKDMFTYSSKDGHVTICPIKNYCLSKIEKVQAR